VFLIPVKRSYIQLSSPGQTERLKGGFKERAGGRRCVRYGRMGGRCVRYGWIGGWKDGHKVGV
jgi:hypothetical protein